MDSPWPANFQDQWAENLSCLKGFQPDVANGVENAEIPDSVLLVTGRDAQPTFQLSSQEQTLEWLGASSMPSVSAPQILSQIHATDANAIIPGMVTGQEPLILLEKFPDSSAIFVIEPNPLLIKLAFHLYDYTAFIRAGSLVIVTTNNWVDQFCAFFEAHSGYELPTQMITVPRCANQEFAMIQQQVERAGQTIFAMHSQKLRHVKVSLDASVKSNLEMPRLVVIGADSRPIAREEMDHIVRASKQWGWPVVSCRADSPSQRHPIQRLQCIEQFEANVVIVVGGWSHTLGQLLPAKLPVICWLTSSSTLPNLEPDDVARIDLLVTPTLRMKKHFEALPIEPDSLYVCPTAIDALHDMQPLASDDMVDVVIVADLPDDRPESFGISLPSQLRLWQAMRDVAFNQAREKADVAKPDDMLAAALKQSGIRLEERDIREHFTNWLEHQIIPARRAIATAEMLEQEGIKFALYGWGWSQLSEGRFQSVQDSCLQAARSQALARTKAVVVLMAHDVECQFLLESLSQAKPVICRGSATVFTQDYPKLATVVSYFDFYQGMDELIPAVRSAICSKSQATRKYDDARTLLLSEHTWKHRLQSVAQHLVKLKQSLVSATS